MGTYDIAASVVIVIEVFDEICAQMENQLSESRWFSDQLERNVA